LTLSWGVQVFLQAKGLYGLRRGGKLS